MGRLLQRLGRLGGSRKRPVILAYHRIAAPSIDPWGLAVHPDRFEAHLDVLRAHRKVLSMSELVTRLAAGTLPDDAVAITFDDGYADNLRNAKPRLARHGFPATLFVTAGAVGQRREFWWDELARAILARTDPFDGEVTVDGQACRIVLAYEADHDATWRAWHEPRTDRQRVYVDLWSRLRAAPAAERNESMLRLRAALSPGPPDDADLPMSADEVEEITRGGLFEIGGHTVTHPLLPLLDPRQRRFEISHGRECCEAIVRRPITGFAYPHGAVDAQSQAAVRESGFSWACTTAGTPVLPDSNLFALPRVCVADCDAGEFARVVS